MKPVRLPASATNALPRWILLALCLLYIIPGLIGRDPWRTDDAVGFGIMWTMANGGPTDWLSPHIIGLPMPEKGPLAYWLGAISIKLFGWLLDAPLAARVSTLVFFLIGSSAVWYTTYLLGRRPEAQPLRLAFGGQPSPKAYGRTLADGALLIYLGCLGLLSHSHSTSAEALQVSLVAFSIYAAARLFDSGSLRASVILGIVLGLLVLTRGYVVPLTMWLALTLFAGFRSRPITARLLLVTLPVAALIGSLWLIALYFFQPTVGAPAAGWLAWNLRQLGMPSVATLRYLGKMGVWFAWPAWPYAAWAVYAWRQQRDALHILLPLIMAAAFLLLAFFHPYPAEESMMLPLLPPLAILAAFGLPTMKRGAINAVDWFSVMTLTACAAFIWFGWVAKQTGWPAWLYRNALKIVPGFKPEFNLIAFIIAALATIAWFIIVHWRISRRPSVLWRAVVLSSGGVILSWLLLMTLWLPWINYGKSYAGVARQAAAHLPKSDFCVATNVGPAQRAVFAYFGAIPFSPPDNVHCEYLLLQDNKRGRDEVESITRFNERWRLLWQGRRPADREERYRLFRRMN